MKISVVAGITSEEVVKNKDFLFLLGKIILGEKIDRKTEISFQQEFPNNLQQKVYVTFYVYQNCRETTTSSAVMAKLEWKP